MVDHRADCDGRGGVVVGLGGSSRVGEEVGVAVGCGDVEVAGDDLTQRRPAADLDGRAQTVDEAALIVVCGQVVVGDSRGGVRGGAAQAHLSPAVWVYQAHRDHGPV